MQREEQRQYQCYASTIVTALETAKHYTDSLNRVNGAGAMLSPTEERKLKQANELLRALDYSLGRLVL